MLPECPRATLGAILNAPQPGHFAIRLGARKPWTPALIYLPCPFVQPDEMDEHYCPEDWCEPLDRAPGPLRARVGETDIEDQVMVIKVWQGARAVTLPEYRYLVARRAWARKYDPDSYHAQPADIRVLKYRDLLG